MPASTTNLAFPKPVITDRLRDGYDAIADLADALDVYLAAHAGRRWVKSGDTTRVAGAAYAADPHLTAMSLPGPGEWEVHCFTAYTASNNAQDVRQYWSAGAGATIGDRWCDGPSTTATDESAATPMVSSVRPYNDAVGYGIGAAAFATGIREWFKVVTTAAATIGLVWAPIASSGGLNTVLKAGSFVSAVRIG